MSFTYKGHYADDCCGTCGDSFCLTCCVWCGVMLQPKELQGMDLEPINDHDPGCPMVTNVYPNHIECLCGHCYVWLSLGTTTCRIPLGPNLMLVVCMDCAARHHLEMEPW